MFSFYFSLIRNCSSKGYKLTDSQVVSFQRTGYDNHPGNEQTNTFSGTVRLSKEIPVDEERRLDEERGGTRQDTNHHLLHTGVICGTCDTVFYLT
jgi:hypothetical protein